MPSFHVTAESNAAGARSGKGAFIYLLVSVTDHDGEPVTSLGRKNFTVFASPFDRGDQLLSEKLTVTDAKETALQGCYLLFVFPAKKDDRWEALDYALAVVVEEESQGRTVTSVTVTAPT